MISVRQALQHVLETLPSMGAEQVPLRTAGGRVLAEAVRAGWDVPPFRNSAMDGYAVRAEDVASADGERPVRLRRLETVGAGAVPLHAVGPRTATKIMTGAMLPDGADAVVRIEDTAETEEHVDVLRPVPRDANVRHPGEDVCCGEVALGPGRPLRAADLGLLASVGASSVRVARRPRVAVLTTGDELVDVGTAPGPGQIVNSNAYALAGAIEEAGAEAVLLGIVRDRRELVRDAFREALRHDVVLSTGGVSVGSFDYVREILLELGYAERFWKVAQKPGKPLTFGLCGETPVFGLPGNPVSSLVCFYVYVLPAVRRMLGVQRLFAPTVAATMAEKTKKSEGLTEFVRCTLEVGADEYLARSTGNQSSGVMRSLSLGDGLIIGPPEMSVLAQGMRVQVLLPNGAPCAAAPPF